MVERRAVAVVASGMPVAALIDSGNKSLHAWIRVDAPDEAEYKRRVGIIWEWFSGINLDKQNRNPSRLSRCPDGWRTVEGEVKRQRLLALGFGADSWAAWESACNAPDEDASPHGACNNSKRDFLAHPDHLARWVERNKQVGAALSEAFNRIGVIHDLGRTVHVARWAYEQGELSAANAWIGPRKLVALDGGWRVALGA